MPTPHAGESVAALCVQLHRTCESYGEATKARAVAEAEYKSSRAKRRLTARSTGEAKSQTEADMVADADDFIAELHQKYLIADALADSLGKNILALRERIGFGRSLMADRREADRLLATHGEG